MMKSFLTLTMLMMLLAACSELQLYDTGSTAPVVDSGRGVNRWLNELHETRAMSVEMQQQLLQAREQGYLDNPSVNNCMRLTLLLATAAEPVGDRKRALELLDHYDDRKGTDSQRELVAILRQYLDEHRKNSRKIGTLTNQLAEQKLRIEELEQQLDALTSIEQEIQQRDKSGVTEGGL